MSTNNTSYFNLSYGGPKYVAHCLDEQMLPSYFDTMNLYITQDKDAHHTHIQDVC